MKRLIKSILFILSLFSFFMIVTIPLRVSAQSATIGIRGIFIDSLFLIVSISIINISLEYYFLERGLFTRFNYFDIIRIRSYWIILSLGLLYLFTYFYLLLTNDISISNKQYCFFYIGFFFFTMSTLIKIKHKLIMCQNRK